MVEFLEEGNIKLRKQSNNNVPAIDFQEDLKTINEETELFREELNIVCEQTQELKKETQDLKKEMQDLKQETQELKNNVHLHEKVHEKHLLKIVYLENVVEELKQGHQELNEKINRKFNNE
jgi:uncharacterized protein YhaN